MLRRTKKLLFSAVTILALVLLLLCARTAFERHMEAIRNLTPREQELYAESVRQLMVLFHQMQGDHGMAALYQNH